jgi:hypothetical protein
LGNVVLLGDVSSLFGGNSFRGLVGLFLRKKGWGVVFANALGLGGLFEEKAEED